MRIRLNQGSRVQNLGEPNFGIFGRMEFSFLFQSVYQISPHDSEEQIAELARVCASDGSSTSPHSIAST